MKWPQVATGESRIRRTLPNPRPPIPLPRVHRREFACGRAGRTKEGWSHRAGKSRGQQQHCRLLEHAWPLTSPARRDTGDTYQRSVRGRGRGTGRSPRDKTFTVNPSPCSWLRLRVEWLLLNVSPASIWADLIFLSALAPSFWQNSCQGQFADSKHHRL